MPSQRCTSAVAMLLVIAAILLANPSTAVSRAVNISSTWFLPQEGFPVFYRYFHDRITWFEADAVCQFHHANLVTVETSVQYDATRAYLKELDIVNNVWIGLKRSGLGEEFTWTDYKTLSPDAGYWQEQIPTSESPLCAVTDPAADFRWHSLNCGGPEIASFICEMPVPPWARQDDGCMLTSLPSLTVIFLPEQGAVELTSDCGLDGTRRIACKGEANREEMMHQLSCDRGGVSQEDDLMSASPDVTSSSSTTYLSSSSASSSSSATSLSSGATSLNSVATSSNSGATSSTSGVTSSSSGATSSNTGATSSNTGATSSNTGATSSSNSEPPISRGTFSGSTSGTISTSYPSRTSGYTPGTRPYTGHSQEPPTRHRRDADHVTSSQMISLVKSTTTVIQDTSSRDVTTSIPHVDKGTVVSTSLLLDSSTITTSGEYTSEASTAGLQPLDNVENVTAYGHVTNQEPQMTTTVEMSDPSTTIPLRISNLLEAMPTTQNEDNTSSQLKHVEMIEVDPTQDSTDTSTLTPITTIRMLINSPLVIKTTRMEIVDTSLSTDDLLVTESSGKSESMRSNESVHEDVSNATVDNRKIMVHTTKDELSTISQTHLNATQTTEVSITTTEDEDVSNFNVEEKSERSDENNSREEDEEERLKEEERKEKEKKFKEEEENRRRLFLPAQLRNFPDVVSEPSNKLQEHPSVEEAYEEPGEMVEPEPEVPSRPNRGRQLTRPQTHSFYPYFLNRVLG